jgi:hypothetical protein
LRRRLLFERSNFGKDTDSEPLIAVLRAHFDEFGFDVIQLAQADNYDVFTGKLGESPASLKGSIFRDLHVDDVQARAWLETAGNPPAPADMAVRVEAGGAQIGDYKPVCSLAIRNIGKTEFERCFVEMIEFSEVVPHKMPMPFAFRTAAQIRAGAEGRFSLSAGQEVIIPVVFHRQQRANEWFLIDDRGEKYFFPANPTKMLLRLYGGPSPGNALLFVDTDAGWHATPSVSTVPSEYTMRAPEVTMR